MLLLDFLLLSLLCRDSFEFQYLLNSHKQERKIRRRRRIVGRIHKTFMFCFVVFLFVKTINQLKNMFIQNNVLNIGWTFFLPSYSFRRQFFSYDFMNMHIVPRCHKRIMKFYFVCNDIIMRFIVVLRDSKSIKSPNIFLFFYHIIKY